MAVTNLDPEVLERIVQERQKATEVTAVILKKKFTNLTVEDTIKLAHEIVIAVRRELS